jgi:serine/threonine protein phosphatase PrpC
MQSEKNFLHDINESSSEVFDLGNYRVGYFIARCLSKETKKNEDCLFYKRQGELFTFGVADGAGGHPRGKDASFIAGNEVLESKQNAAIELIESINDKILELKAGARTTLAFGQIKNDQVRFHSVGDSEILFWNAHGSLLYSSVPHSNIGHQIRAGMISQQESLEAPNRNVVNHLLGDEFVRIEATSSMSIKKGQTLIIGSDGLFDNISHESLTELVGKGQFDEGFKALKDKCLEQDKDIWLKEDDIAFIVVRKTKNEE